MQRCATLAATLLLVFPLTASAVLVAEYDFSGNANDTSGNSLHGTVNGAVPTADRFGNVNSAYLFDGNDRIEVAHNPLLNPTTGEWSMSVWIKSTQGRWIMGMGWDGITPGPAFSYGLGVFPPRAPVVSAWCCAGGSHMNAFPESTFGLDGAWHHVAGTIKNNVIAKLYVDAALVATDDPTDASGPWNINVIAPFWIGDVQNASGDPFVGIIDDVRLFNHVLSDEEIVALFRVPEPPTSTVALIAVVTLGIAARRVKPRACPAV